MPNIQALLDEMAKSYFITIENVDPDVYEELPEGGWSLELEDRGEQRSYTGVWLGESLSDIVGRAWAGSPEDRQG